MAAVAQPMDPPLPAIAAGRRWSNRSVERMATYAIHAAIQLGVLESLSAGPASAGALAQRLESHPDAMYRLLRALVSLDVLSQRSGLFCLGPLAPFAAGGRIGDPDPSNPLELEWVELAQSVRTGVPAFELRHGKPLFEYLDGQPELSRWFQQSMTSRGEERDQAVVRECDFSRFSTIVDVGGGTGGLLTRILRRHPRARGVLFDVRSAIDEAARVADRAVSERLTMIAGNMFERIPAGDAHILSSVLHDWTDDQALRLLRAVRSAMTDAGSLLVVEMILPVDRGDAWLMLLDLDMLTVTGGRERTAAEYRRLLACAGLKVETTIETHSHHAVIEARPFDRKGPARGMRPRRTRDSSKFPPVVSKRARR